MNTQPYNAILRTPHFELRGWDQTTYDQVFSTCTDEEIKAHLGLSTQEELEMEKEKHQKGMSTFNITFQSFQIVEPASKRTVGWIGFHSWAKQHRRAEIYYHIKDERDRGQGIMSEVLPVVLQYGRQEMNLRRVEAFVDITNTPSEALLKRNQFEWQAKVKHRYLFNEDGEWDHFYALLWEG